MVIFLGALASCAPSSDPEGDAGKNNVESVTKSEAYSYQFSENGCDTGKHEFTSKDSLCSALADSALNNGCAYSLRESEYRAQGCSGSFTAANASRPSNISSSGSTSSGGSVHLPARHAPAAPVVEEVDEITVDAEFTKIDGLQMPLLVQGENQFYMNQTLELRVTQFSDTQERSLSRSLLPGSETGSPVAKFSIPSNRVKWIRPSLGNCKDATLSVFPLSSTGVAVVMIEANVSDPAACLQFASMVSGGAEIEFDGGYTYTGSPDRDFKKLVLKFGPKAK